MKIGDRCFVQGYVDEIRKDTVIIRNKGGYFGTDPGEVVVVFNTAHSNWVPCSERLPEEYGEYRITWITSASKKRFIGDAEYEVTGEWDAEHDRFKGEWLLDGYIDYPDVKVLAWKPLEEPYQEEGEK